jgi:hypothetical protein
MEAARVSVGLEGVWFRYYTCPRCGHDHVFLEVAPLPGETGCEIDNRRAALARAAREVRVLETTVLVVEHGVWPGFAESQNEGVNTMTEEDVIANQQTIMSNQERILANQDVIKGNQGKLDKVLSNQAALLSNQGALMKNQQTIMANQAKLDQVLANQASLLANQETIQGNQGKLLDNQAGIIANQEQRILSNQQRILANQEKIMTKWLRNSARVGLAGQAGTVRSASPVRS